jgi:hypothetical protein
MTVNAAARTADCEQSSASIKRHRLVPGETRRLRRGHQILRVIAGQAWVTAGKGDVFLGMDEEVEIQGGGVPAIVSSLGDCPLVYEMRQEPC